MALKFEHIIDIAANSISPADVHQTYIINEVKGDIVDYYRKDFNAAEKSQIYANEPIDYSNINLNHHTESFARGKVSRIGVRSFPSFGGYGFYKDKNTGISTIVCPINPIPIEHKAPTLRFSYSGGRCHFEIEPPKDSNYECYRIVFSNGDFSEEYITYETVYDCDAPRVVGTYEVYCIGYIEKEQKVSSKSNKFSYTASSGKESFAPDGSISYYTKEQIQAIIADLTDKYLREAAFVEDGTKLKFTMSDNTSFYASGKPAGGGSPQLPITIANAVVAGGTKATSSLNNTLNVVANSDVLLCVISRSTVTAPEGFELLYEIPPIVDPDSIRQCLRIYKKHYETTQEVNISGTQDGTNSSFNFFACNILNANNYIIGQIINQNIEAEDVDTVNVIKSSLNAIIISHQTYAHSDTVINAYNPSENCLLFDANARGHYIIDKSSETSHELSLKSSPSGSIDKYKVWQTVVLNIS